MRSQQLILFFLAINLLVTQGIAEARTWSVELDGSGNFTDIQPAVEAAADGDSILIGPGRFDQLHPCVAPAWTEDAIVAVTQDNLTFIGSGTDQTIIGMTEYFWSDFAAPKGFCSVDAYSATIKDLTIENIETGIYWWRGVLDVENCILRGDHFSYNAAAVWVDGGSFRNCRFEIGSNSVGLFCTEMQSISVSNCVFDGYGLGFTTGVAAQRVSFTDCSFSGNRVAMIYAQGCSGNIRNTSVTDVYSEALQVFGASTPMELENFRITGGQTGIIAVLGSVISGVDVVIEGTTIAAMEISAEAEVTLNNSHLLPLTGDAVRALGTTGPDFNLDFSGNYWGTTDADSIAAMIYDSQDDPSIHYTIQFEPFADGPVPTEKKSFGSFKAMFRDATR